MKTFFFITVLLAFLADAYAQTVVSGLIEREVRWRAEDGPYIVEGDILVSRRGSLVILPGTRVIVKNKAAKLGLADPFDKADSTLASIRVQGVIKCVGRKNDPITFEAENSGLANFTWRGIIIDNVDGKHSEIAFVNISGASTALTLSNTDIMVRNSAFENSNIGIHAMQGGAPRIYNNLMSNCFTAAVKIERSNPQIQNNIIAFNNNIGLWCDNKSKITFRNNCVFGNADNNFLDCDPELGRVSGGARNRNAEDTFGNIISDPIFAGSAAETRAKELDINLRTDSSRVKNKGLFGIPNFQSSSPPPKPVITKIGSESRQLSGYSPCINAGDSGGKFKNTDGSRNTIGPAGGPEFWDK